MLTNDAPFTAVLSETTEKCAKIGHQHDGSVHGTYLRCRRCNCLYWLPAKKVLDNK